MSLTLGRLPQALVGKSIPYDAPERTVQALLTANDKLIDAIKAIAAKLDADAGVTDTNYAATITNSLQKIDLI